MLVVYYCYYSTTYPDGQSVAAVGSGGASDVSRFSEVDQLTVVVARFRDSTLKLCLEMKIFTWTHFEVTNKNYNNDDVLHPQTL